MKKIGDTEEFFVMEEGIVYVSGLLNENELEAEWEGDNRCIFSVKYVKDKTNPIPELGTMVCRRTG